MPNRKLSSIEMTVLGLAWLRGPCTTYTIMKVLSGAASSYHNSRAGTAYSVVKRLQKFEMISVPEGDENLVSITAEGLKALQGWLTDPVPMSDISHSADLIRLRFYFVGAIDRSSQLELIEKAKEGLQEFLKTCDHLVYENEKLGEFYGGLATISAILETRARIEWLNVVKAWIQNPPEEGQPWASRLLKSLEVPD